MEKTIKRRFSLEEDFMNFKTDDLLYGFLRSLSTARPDLENRGEWSEYLPIKTFKTNKKVIAGICNCSTKTIDRHLDKLFEAGLLDQGVEVIEKIEKDGTVKEYEYECFWFPYDPDGKYKILEQDIVRYLVHTRNPQAIRIYLYLLNKYQWKKDYVFTIGEIKTALGYAQTTKSADSMIKDCLASFNKEGLIKYEKFIEQVEIGDCNTVKIIPVERMKLKYVITESKDLPVF